MTPMTHMTIGQLAKRVGIGVETVRFYERRGLIDEPPRRPSGYRQYPLQAAARLRFIRRAKELGFTLDEIGELLSLRSRPGENRDVVRAKARTKITNIERRLADLTRMRDVLAELADACEHHHDTERCPILEALEGMSIQEES